MSIIYIMEILRTAYFECFIEAPWCSCFEKNAFTLFGFVMF